MKLFIVVICIITLGSCNNLEKGAAENQIRARVPHCKSVERIFANNPDWDIYVAKDSLDNTLYFKVNDCCVSFIDSNQR